MGSNPTAVKIFELESHLRCSFALSFDACVYVEDTVAEWLRRRPAKPTGSPRVGSNPTGVGLQLEALRFFACTGVDVQKRGCSGN